MKQASRILLAGALQNLLFEGSVANLPSEQAVRAKEEPRERGVGLSERGLSCPLSREKVVETYFLEHRAKLIDIAAFLDRVDRSPSNEKGDEREGASSEIEDYRLVAFRKAIAILLEGDAGRTRRIQELFSDSSVELPQSAHGTKGAAGAAPTGGTS